MSNTHSTEPAREPRHPDSSAVTMTELLMPQHTNTLGTAFGGQILSWVDIAASVCASRHCGTDTVTASMDDIHFKVPIQLGDVVVIEARMCCVGRTSMDIEVRVWRELRGADRQQALDAWVTFVSVDDHGKPMQVPGLIVDNDADRSRYESGKQRRKQRLERAR